MRITGYAIASVCAIALVLGVFVWLKHDEGHVAAEIEGTPGSLGSGSLVVTQRPSTTQERPDSPRAFFLRQISFPLNYDGRPDSLARPEVAEKIVSIHRRLWSNYAKIGSLSLTYSRRTYHRGQPDRGGGGARDMDAEVQIELGEKMTLTGRDADGGMFTSTVSPEGQISTRDGGENWASLMYEISRMRQAKPEMCAVYSDLIEDMAMEGSGAGSPRYDVLIVKTRSDEDRNVPAEAYHWYNRSTGMIDKVEWRDPLVKQRAGSYCTETYAYEPFEGIYIATSIARASPADGGWRTVETCSNVRVVPRPKAP